MTARKFLLAIYVTVAMMASPGLAHAYIDPNSGGLLFQFLAPLFAGIMGAWLFLRRQAAVMFGWVWRRMFHRRPK